MLHVSSHADELS